MGSLSHSI